MKRRWAPQPGGEEPSGAPSLRRILKVGAPRGGRERGESVRGDVNAWRQRRSGESTKCRGATEEIVKGFYLLPTHYGRLELRSLNVHNSPLTSPHGSPIHRSRHGTRVFSFSCGVRPRSGEHRRRDSDTANGNRTS